MKKGKCVYFTGTRDEACEKGINYRSTAPGPAMGWATRIPCFSDHSGHCGEYREPTPEEIRAHEEKVEKSINGMTAALHIIREKTRLT